MKLLKSPIDTPEKLCNARIIGVAEDSEPANVWVLSSGEEMKSVKLFPVLSTNSSQVATQWALQGLGIMLRSNWAVKNFIESGCLVRVLPEWAMHSDGYAYYAMHRLSRNARAFLTYLISEIKLKEL